MKKDLDEGIHSLTKLLYNFCVGYPTITGFALKLEYANNYTTPPNQNKQIKKKFQIKLFVG